MSSLISAQDKCICTDVAFLDLEITKPISTPPLEFDVLNRFFNSGKNIILSDIDKDEFRDRSLKTILTNSNKLSDRYQASSIDFYGINLGNWINLLNSFYGTSSRDQITENYELFIIENNLEMLGTRTTLQTGKALNYLDENPDVFWLEIIRNPLARYYSAKRAHSIKPEVSFKTSVWQKNIIEEISHERFLVVEYESLVANTASVLTEIYCKLGHSGNALKLYGVGPDMEVMYGNSSDNESIYFQDNNRAPVYSTSLNSYEGKLSSFELAMAAYFGCSVEKINFLNRLQVWADLFYSRICRLGEFVFLSLSLFMKGMAILFGVLGFGFIKGYSLKNKIIRAFNTQSKNFKKFKY